MKEEKEEFDLNEEVEFQDEIDFEEKKRQLLAKYKASLTKIKKEEKKKQVKKDKNLLEILNLLNFNGILDVYNSNDLNFLIGLIVNSKDVSYEEKENLRNVGKSFIKKALVDKEKDKKNKN